MSCNHSLPLLAARQCFDAETGLATVREIHLFQDLSAFRVVAVPENCRSYPILGGSMPCDGIDVEVVRKTGAKQLARNGG